MGYWKTRVVPRIMKIFEKDGSKKTAAGEACKAFDESKVSFSLCLSLYLLSLMGLWTLGLFFHGYFLFFMTLSRS